jgi:uncharacterized protein (DUF2384 family)
MSVQSDNVPPTELPGLPQVLASAINTLGSSEKAWSWLRTPNMVLDGERPLDLLDTAEGVFAGETVLRRIEWG